MNDTTYGFTEEEFKEINELLALAPEWRPGVDYDEYRREERKAFHKMVGRLIELDVYHRLYYHRIRYRRARLASLVKGPTPYEVQLQTVIGFARGVRNGRVGHPCYLPRAEEWDQPRRIDEVRTTDEYLALKAWAKGKFQYSDGWRTYTYRGKEGVTAQVLLKILQLRTGAFLEEATPRRVRAVLVPVDHWVYVEGLDKWENQPQPLPEAEYLELVRAIRPELVEDNNE